MTRRKKRKPNEPLPEEFTEVAIDGSTLEKRRDQRKEQLVQYLATLDEEDRQGVMGKVNQWTKAEGVRVVDASQSLVGQGPRPRAEEVDENVYRLESGRTLRQPNIAPHEFEAPAIVKRTPQQRLEALTKRLIDADPVSQQVLLKEIAGEYWKAGMPVTVDALQAAAAKLLNRTERKKR